MAKNRLLFNVDFRTGSFKDWVSGDLGTSSGAKIIRTDKGLALDTMVKLVRNYGFELDVSKPFTIETTYIRGQPHDQFYRVFTIKSNMGENLSISVSDHDNYLGFFFGALENVDNICMRRKVPYNKLFHIIVTYNGQGLNNKNNFKMYLNGVEESMKSAGSMSTPVKNETIIAGRLLPNGAETYFGKGVIHFAKIYDGCFTSEDVLEAQSAFLQGENYTKPKSNFHYPKPKESKEDGLVAHYNMQRVGNVLPDISGHGNDGVISSGVIQTADSLSFNGKNGCVEVTPFTENVKTICARVYHLTNKQNQDILTIRADSSSIMILATSLNQAQIGCYDGARVIDLAATPPTRTWNSYVFTIDDDNNIQVNVNGVYSGKRQTRLNFTNSKKMYIGFNGGVFYYSANIKDIKIYDRALSDQEIKDYHNSFASQVYFIDDFAFDISDKVPQGWTRLTGKFAKTENGLECLTNGKVYINYDQKGNADIKLEYYYKSTDKIEVIHTTIDELTTELICEQKSNKLIFTMLAGDYIKSIKIYKGVSV